MWSVLRVSLLSSKDSEDKHSMTWREDIALQLQDMGTFLVLFSCYQLKQNMYFS